MGLASVDLVSFVAFVEHSGPGMVVTGQKYTFQAWEPLPRRHFEDRVAEACVDRTVGTEPEMAVGDADIRVSISENIIYD